MAVNMKEVCVGPFIGRVQGIFAEGGSVRDALSQIRPFQEKLTNVQNIAADARFLHWLAGTSATLTGVVLYEGVRNYAATRGVVLPGSLEMIAASLPVASVSGSGPAGHTENQGGSATQGQSGPLSTPDGLNTFGGRHPQQNLRKEGMVVVNNNRFNGSLPVGKNIDGARRVLGRPRKGGRGSARAGNLPGGGSSNR